MAESSESPDVKAVQKVLGEPIFCGLSDRAWRVRTQLFSVSLLALSLSWFQLKVNQEATLLGFSLTGVTDSSIRWGALIALAYLTIHFVWLAWESFVEWKLRLTGTRTGFITAGIFAGPHSDYPSDPQQSTLSNWWKEQSRSIKNVPKELAEITALVESYKSRILTACESKEPLNVANATAPMNSIVNSLTQMGRSIEEASKIMDTQRIPASLERFEAWHKYFLISQNIRWLLIDVGLPILLGLIAMIYLSRSVACYILV